VGRGGGNFYLYSKRKQSTRLMLGTYIGAYIGSHSVCIDKYRYISVYASLNTGIYRCMSVNEMDPERDGVKRRGLWEKC
jgi:hypothetical protein